MRNVPGGDVAGKRSEKEFDQIARENPAVFLNVQRFTINAFSAMSLAEDVA